MRSLSKEGVRCTSKNEVRNGDAYRIASPGRNMRRRINRSRNNNSSSTQTRKERYLHNNSRGGGEAAQAIPASFMHARKGNHSPYHPSNMKSVDPAHQASIMM